MEKPVSSESAYSSHEALGVTRLLLSSARHYAAALPSGDSVFEGAIDEGIKRFSELARAQLAPQYIEQRLSLDDGRVQDLSKTLEAIDTELAGWQRGGIVTSQIEPLEEFNEWLYSLHTLESLELISDDATRRTIERCIARAAAVLVS